MSYPPEHSDHWLDAQLRAVPVPDGLHGRLVRVAEQGPRELSDSDLDARLRDVPVPPGVIGPASGGREPPDFVAVAEIDPVRRLTSPARQTARRPTLREEFALADVRLAPTLGGLSNIAPEVMTSVGAIHGPLDARMA